MKKKFIKMIPLIVILLCSIIGLISCDVNIDLTLDLSSNYHLCYYGYQSTGLEIISKENQFNNEAKKWAEDKTTPTVYHYHLLSDFSDSQVDAFSIGNNVYVGICCFMSSYTASSTKVTLNGENGGIFFYDCTRHGCFNAMDDAIPLSKGYMDFVSAVAKAKEGVFTLSSGSYSMSEVFDLKAYFDSKLVVLENANKTTLCLDGLSYESVKDSVDYLAGLGVTTYTEPCLEPASTAKSHDDCCYYKLLGDIPYNKAKIALDQSTINYYLNLAEETGEVISQSGIAFLTENVQWDGELKVDENNFIVVCKNGFDLKGKVSNNVLILDCTDHSCLYDGYSAYYPVSQEFLTYREVLIANKLVSEVLPAGKYALMGDVDFSGFTVKIDEQAEYEVCLNGYKVAGLQLPQNVKVHDCTTITDSNATSLAHVCDKVAPHASAIYVGSQDLNNTDISTLQGDISIALKEDVYVNDIIVIPTGLKMTICLNGHEIVGVQREIPQIFKVEYGAELILCDCSSDHTGRVILKMPDESEDTSTSTSESNESNTDPNKRIFGVEHNFVLNACVYNAGTLVIKDANVYGQTGVYNAGVLHVNGGSMNGMVAGLLQMVGDEEYSPLCSSNIQSSIKNCEVVGYIAGMAAVQGECSIDSVNCYAVLIGMYCNTNVVVEDVTVNIVLRADVMAILKDVEVGSIEGFSPEMESYIAIAAGNGIVIEGNVEFSVSPDFLVPFEKSSNNQNVTVTPEFQEVVLSNGKVDIAPWVDLEKPVQVIVEVSENKEEYVIANNDIIGQIDTIDGYALCLNSSGQTVVISADVAGFMDNAIVTSLSVEESGQISMEFECEFDKNTASESFLNNQDAKVIVMSDDKEVYNVSPLYGKTDNGYYFKIQVAPKDYKKDFQIKFYNGKYIWNGREVFNLENQLLGVIEQLSTVGKASENPEQSAMLKIVAESALNYCRAAAYHFGTISEYAPVDGVVSFDGETSFTYQQIMSSITASDLEMCAPKINNEEMPKGVKLQGTTLVLEASTTVRLYFSIDEAVYEKISVTVDGQSYQLEPYEKVKNSYVLEIANINAQDILSMFEIVITDGETTCSIEYGAGSYVYTSISRGTSSKSTQDMMRALVVYAYASNAYEEMCNTEVENNEDLPTA